MRHGRVGECVWNDLAVRPGRPILLLMLQVQPVDDDTGDDNEEENGKSHAYDQSQVGFSRWCCYWKIKYYLLSSSESY